MSGPYRKPPVDVFTTLLAISLVALIIAAIFAYVETSDYGDNKYQGAPPIVPVASRTISVMPESFASNASFATAKYFFKKHS